MVKNKVFINQHDLIEINVNGDQTVHSVVKMADEAEELLQQLAAQEKPALILDSLLQVGTVPPEARKIVVERAKAIDFDRLAFLGKGTVLRFGANLMLQAISKSDKVKYFDDYDRAVEWLKSA